MPRPKVIQSLKNDDCIDCGADIKKGDPCWINPEYKKIYCIECGTIRFEI